MSAKLHFGWTLAAILVVALALRIVAGLWWQQRLPVGTKFGFGDSESYWELARTIARGQPYAYGPAQMRIFRTPGYPAVLAPLFGIADEPPVFWGRLVSAILSTAAVGLVAGLALALFDHRTALIAAAMAACYPEAIAAGAFVLSEAAFTPAMVLHLLFWVIAWRADGKTSVPSSARITWIVMATLAGVAAGIATLIRPSWLLFIPFAGVVGLVVCRERSKHMIITAVMIAALSVTMLPWWVRNYLVAGRFVPTSLQVGASLYDGISPAATGASDMEFVGEFVAEQRAADAASPVPPPGLFEDRLDQRMKDAAVTWARDNPQKVLALAATKLRRMWGIFPNANEFQSNSLRLVLALSYTPLILVALIGGWRFAGKDWSYLLCCLPAVYLTLLHIVFVSSIRYRQPAMMALIALAAAVVARYQVPGARSQGPA